MENNDQACDVPGNRPPSIAKTAIGGVLMGIANLIPGVSGGTMVLAVGLYNEFIDAVADLTAFRFSRRRIVFLGVLGGCAAVSIKGLAPVILYLLFHYDSAMYALFIGMTLGGAPILARSLGRISLSNIVAVACGLAVMVAVVLARDRAAVPQSTAVDVLAGLVAATTMVLPGISGSYMLLIMDQYERIVAAVRDLNFAIIVPVGIGAVAGVVLLSNILKLLLHRFERATIGFLLGMLLGSVIGLWPFGRIPSDDALNDRSPTELMQFAERRGIDVPQDLSPDALAGHILEHWSADGTLDPYAPMTVGFAALAACAGFIATYSMSRKGASLRGRSFETMGEEREGSVHGGAQ